MEKQDMLAREKEENERYQEQQEMYRRQLVLLEREKMNEQHREARALAHFHQGQKLEKTVQKKHLEKAVYQNPVSPEYFEQFGKSCR